MTGRDALAWIAIAALAAGQESAPASAPSIDRIVDRANHANPYISAQGVKALKTLHARGEPVLPALRRFIDRRSIHALAPLVVEWLGEVSEDGARALLKDALDNRVFPWRPQAARALSRAPRAGEVELFILASRDDLPAVREAALTALGQIGSWGEEYRPRAVHWLEQGLSDRLFEPKLAAAESLLRLGAKSSLPVLVDALCVDRRFFDLDFGVIARTRAWESLKPLAGDGVAYEPSAAPARSAPAIDGIARRLGVAREASRRESPDVEGPVLGIEIRSCRAGDQWIRLTGDGDLVLGHYDLDRRKVDAKTLRDILVAVRAAAEARSPESRLHSDRLFGRGGCDYEKWYLPDESGLLRVTVGLDGRPDGLQRVQEAIAGAIDDAFGRDAGQEYRDRTAPFARPDEGED